MNDEDEELTVITLTGTSGQVVTTTSGGAGWGYSNGYNISTSASWKQPYEDVITVGKGLSGSGNSIEIKGDANFDGDIKLQGRSLSDTLAKIEERLAILRPNTELEDKWNELKLLGEQYRMLEKQILEKEKVWNILNK